MNFIPQMEPWFGTEEKTAICEYMEAGGWLTEFKKTEEFEKTIAEFTGTRHCVVVNNGTISLTLAALACGIKAGDEVIVPNYSMIATANSVKMIGAIPVFVDVEKQTLCMNIGSAEKAVTKKTKAIILVTANGRYPKSGIETFVNFAKKHNLIFIEDAAQSLGSRYPDGRHQGSVGMVGSFSFSTPKIISTGQGGALITNDDEIAARLRRLKDFGRARGGIDIHDTIGYNFKFTDLQAVVGLEQFKKLSWRIERKKEINKLYKELLKDVKEVEFFEQDLTNTTPWFVDVLVEDRENLMDYLKQNEVGVRVMYPPMNKQKAYNVPGDHPVSNLVDEKGLWIPSSSQLKDIHIEYISTQIKKYFS